MLDMSSASRMPRRTAMQSATAGVAQSLRHGRLVLVVWGVFLALAWLAALPAWRWFDSLLSFAPEGDRLLSGLNIALLRELTHYDRSPTMRVALGSASTFFVLALMLNPFMAGGTLGVLMSAESAARDATLRGVAPHRVATGVTQRFVGEGARWYWRLARVLLVVGLLGGGVTILLTTGLEAAGAAFDDGGWARASMWTENVTLLTCLVMFGLSSLIVDISRILMVRRDDGRAAAAVKHALGFLWRNAGAVLAIGAIFLVLLSVAIAVYNLIASSITPLTWGLIAFTIALQQLFALARTSLRIALLATLADLVAVRDPVPIAAPLHADVAPADEPVYELPLLG
jgi:hypothetical protein